MDEPPLEVAEVEKMGSTGVQCVIQMNKIKYGCRNKTFLDHPLLGQLKQTTAVD